MLRGAITASWLALAACSGGAASPGSAPQEIAPPAGAGALCEISAAAAKKRVIEAVPAQLDCHADEDCQAVMLIASCFNECATAVNRTGAGAIDRASTLVEAHECKEFANAGCKLPDKQCEAPAKSSCAAGKCAF